MRGNELQEEVGEGDARQAHKKKQEAGPADEETPDKHHKMKKNREREISRLPLLLLLLLLLLLIDAILHLPFICSCSNVILLLHFFP